MLSIITLPSTEIVIDAMTNGTDTWVSAFLPLATMCLGISLAFLLLNALINWIQNKLDWDNEKEDLLERKIIYQELLGEREGGLAFEERRLLDQLPLTDERHIVPRDSRAGESAHQFLQRHRYSAEKAPQQALHGKIWVQGTGWI